MKMRSVHLQQSDPFFLHCRLTLLLLLLLLLLLASRTSFVHSSSLPTPPPLPIPPLPSAAQLRWQLGEMAMFLHFGPNTFTDSEWGTGRADPSVFAPTALDARQWATAAAAGGFARVVLTAKHHDGFCLWPSAYTNYSVASSPWRGGRGDVMSDLAAAAREVGIGMGVYLSPWDRHEPCYGQTTEYNEHFLGQMKELLTKYGDIQEVFLDGAKGEDEKDMFYFFDIWFQFIHQLQPGSVIFTDAGPDSRWVGDESGSAGYTCWSLFNKSAVSIGGDNNPEYEGQGDPHGVDWVPAECDVSIRPGWFWHRSEQPKSALELLNIYYKSVGRNCILILNVPPNSSGLLSREDLKVLHDFKVLRTTIFFHSYSQNATVLASSVRGGAESWFSPSNVLEEGIYTYWAPEEGETAWVLYFDLGRTIKFNVFLVQEPIQMGQRVISFQVDIQTCGEWKTIVYGTTIGYKRILRFPAVESQFLRFTVNESRADPLISYIGVYMDLFSNDHDMHDLKSSSATLSSVNTTRPKREMANVNFGNESVAAI